LARKFIGAHSAIILALLFSLYPTNNFYLWQVTMNYQLGMLLMLLSIFFFWKNRYFYSLILFIVSLLVNEATAMLFVLAILPVVIHSFSSELQSGIMPKVRSLLKQKATQIWLWLFFGIIFVYGISRIIAEKTGLINGGRLVSVLGHFSLILYLKQFVTGEITVILLSWAVAGWKILYYTNVSSILIGVIVALLVLVFLRFCTERPLGSFKPLYLVLLGIILIIAGRYYGFYYIPSINVLNLDSRYYFSASLGGAMVITGLLEWLRLRYLNFMSYLIIVCLMFGFLGMFKFQVQTDYSNSWTAAKKIWQTIFAEIPALPAGSLVYVDVPGNNLGKLVGAFQGMGDLRILIPYFYGNGASGISTPYIQNMKQNVGELCFDSAPFYKNQCYSQNLILTFKWQNGELVQTSGNLSITKNGSKPKIPDGVKRVFSLQ
jgi:hypothetical protein